MTEKKQCVSNNRGDDGSSNNDSGVSSGSTMSLLQQFRSAVSGNNSDQVQVVETLERLQQEIGRRGLFSRNETLEDWPTGHLPLLLVEHYLAAAYVNLPTSSCPPTAADLSDRRLHLQRAVDLWTAFFDGLLRANVVDEEDEKQQVKQLLELSSALDNNDESSSDAATFMRTTRPAADRNAKIARHRAHQAARQECARLEALQQRRIRLRVQETESADGFDDVESLRRALYLQEIRVASHAALEEWAGTLREIPMLQMAVKQRQQRQQQQQGGAPDDDDDRYRRRPNSQHAGAAAAAQRSNPPVPAGGGGPLQVTQITKNAATGELQMQRQEIKAGVFRPFWNQPTMSLEELGEREVRAALDREARQKAQEASSQQQPARYEVLVRRGLDDDADLVDASAPLDRAWDDFKDENPRGSGNKRANVGDKNF